MNCTITIATVALGTKKVPLTKDIVRQLETLHPADYAIEDVRILGCVELAEAFIYLYKTPDGLQRSRHLNTNVKDLTDTVINDRQVTRIILIK